MDRPGAAPPPGPEDGVAAGPALSRSITGIVSHYDDDAGLGTVEAGGAMRYPFHCTAIADGSRHIDAGVRVRFVLAPGHAGRIEARELVPLSGGDASEGSGPALP